MLLMISRSLYRVKILVLQRFVCFAADAKQLPYMVERTKNHMVPVYLRLTQRGLRKVTLVKNIQGDIFKLEEEMRRYVEMRAGKVVGTQINEPAGLIKFRGDHVSNCRRFLDSKGF